MGSMGVRSLLNPDGNLRPEFWPNSMPNTKDVYAWRRVHTHAIERSDDVSRAKNKCSAVHRALGNIWGRRESQCAGVVETAEPILEIDRIATDIC